MRQTHKHAIAKAILTTSYGEMREVADELIQQVQGRRDDGAAFNWQNNADLADLIWWWAMNEIES